jgi:hypothetical protein
VTVRKSVSYLENRWYDGQRVDQIDMNIEQNRNVSYDSSIVQNHFGSGVVPLSPVQKVLFDTENLFPDQVALIASNDFDGTGLRPLEQPTDNSLGNQLEVELTDSNPEIYPWHWQSTAMGRLCTKVLVIGLDFQGNLQYDRFYFYKKEKQVTKKHYSKILTVFFNDFFGNNNCSRKLGGRVIIRETSSFQLSRDPVMIEQDVQPNLFFRDFKVSNTSVGANPTATLYQTIQTAIGTEYNVDSLWINTTVKRDFELVADDITTRLGEKFLANNNNIQKISLLLGVRKDTTSDTDKEYDWSGELLVSVYELQSSISCPTDLVPELAIEFEPNPIPLTQFSLDQDDFKRLGYVLSDVLQPIDLIFSNTLLSDTINPIIVPGKFYIFTIGRAGDASTGTLFTGIGNSQTTNDRFTIFTSEWTDVPEEDMWYQVWSDSAKVADGFAYDDGNGMEISKTNTNTLGAVVDYVFDQKAFADVGQNTLNTAVVKAVLVQSVQEQDERTGNPVYARQKFEPSFSFVTTTNLETLRETSEPVVIGCARDTNPKSGEDISGTQLFPGLAKGNVFHVLAPNSDLISQQLIGSALIPNDECQAKEYKIVSTVLCTDGYGDINGDGIVDDLDIFRASELLGESLLLSSTQLKILNGEIDTLEIIRGDVDGDGYITATDINHITAYVAKTRASFDIGDTFQRLEIIVQRPTGRADGYYDCGDGYIRLDGYSLQNIVSVSDLTDKELEVYGYNGFPDVEAEDPAYQLVPFEAIPFRVRSSLFWEDYLLQFKSNAREVPVTFTSSTTPDNLLTSLGTCDESNDSICQETFTFGANVCDPGVNDFYVPNNLIMGNGQILDRYGNFHKQDIELHVITIEIPEVPLGRGVLDVFNKLVVNHENGRTSAGFTAARFSDCTFVESDALVKNQIRFGLSIASIAPSLDGYNWDLGYGVISDDYLAAYIDQEEGILYFTMKDALSSAIYPELRPKIQITAYLKKAGWNNTPLTVPRDQVIGLLSSNDPYP